MTQLAEKLRRELTILSETERGELTQFLIQSLDPESKISTEPTCSADLNQRMKKMRGFLKGMNPSIRREEDRI